ncbi:MAG: hypothetical protein GY850_10535 [bacterium]|nr:hypothetical protein [bacterium]
MKKRKQSPEDNTPRQQRDLPVNPSDDLGETPLSLSSQCSPAGECLVEDDIDYTW